jgi:4'-phosphopantetheinyl transferase
MPARLDRDVVHLWRTSTRISPISACDLQALLSRDERAKAIRFRRDGDRERYVVSHAMLRLVLSHYVGAPPAELEFAIEAHGKPRLGPIPVSNLSFNLAHSGDLALLAISRGPAVGVDLEAIRDDVDVPALARSVLSKAELRVLRAAPLERQRSLFFRSWVRKEAVLKGCGVGLALEPDRVIVLQDETKDDTGFVAVKLSAGSAQWGVRDVEIGDRYAGAVAAPGRDWTLRCFEHRWSVLTRPASSPGRDRPG